MLLTFQEEQLEDDSLKVPADPSQCRLGTHSDTIHIPQLHLLICARGLP